MKNTNCNIVSGTSGAWANATCDCSSLNITTNPNLIFIDHIRFNGTGNVQFVGFGNLTCRSMAQDLACNIGWDKGVGGGCL